MQNDSTNDISNNKENDSHSSNFIFYEVEQTGLTSFDDFDVLIKQYSDQVTLNRYEDCLLFWKCHESQFSLLAKLAKKFLGVPASSAAVERMFKISGNILTNRRRKTGIALFENLVFLKLNEDLL